MSGKQIDGVIEIEGKRYRMSGEVRPIEDAPPGDLPPVYPFGPYARYGQGDRTGYLSKNEWDKMNHPRCRGGVVIFMWRALEQDEGVYTLDAIGAAMEEAAKRDRKLGVYVRDYAFSGPGKDPKNSHPDYVLNNPARFGGRQGTGGMFLHSNKDFNNGKHTKGSNRYRTAFWMPEITDRRVALMAEIFAYIDAHPLRDTVTFVKNTASTSGPSGKCSEWDDNPANKYTAVKLRDQHLRYIDAVAPLRLAGGANFCFNGELVPESPRGADGRQTYLLDLYQRCADHQIGWCQPDPMKAAATFNGSNYGNDSIAFAGRGETWTYDDGEFAAGAWDKLSKLYGDGNSLEDHARVFLAPSTVGGVRCLAMAIVTHQEAQNPLINFDVWMGLFDDENLPDDLLEDLQQFAERGLDDD